MKEELLKIYNKLKDLSTRKESGEEGEDVEEDIEEAVEDIDIRFLISCYEKQNTVAGTIEPIEYETKQEKQESAG